MIDLCVKNARDVIVNGTVIQETNSHIGDFSHMVIRFPLVGY